MVQLDDFNYVVGKAKTMSFRKRHWQTIGLQLVTDDDFSESVRYMIETVELDVDLNFVDIFLEPIHCPKWATSIMHRISV